METDFNKNQYTDEILSLLDNSQDKRKDLEDIIDKMAKKISLQTFERNLTMFGAENSHVRRI